jgi:hypothetical protein
VAVVAAETVAVAVAPGVTLAGLKLTVTPLGAVALRVTGWVKPLAADTATGNVAVWPGKTETEEDLGVTASDGAFTVTDSLDDPVNVPLLAVIAMLPAPAAAVFDAETVAVEVPPGVTLAGLKLTVTPLGAVALRVTAWVKPLAADTATVKVVVWP